MDSVMRKEIKPKDKQNSNEQYFFFAENEEITFEWIIIIDQTNSLTWDLEFGLFIIWAGKKWASLFYLLTTERKCVLVTQQSRFWYFRQFDIQLIQVYTKLRMVPEEEGGLFLECYRSIEWKNSIVQSHK